MEEELLKSAKEVSVEVYKDLASPTAKVLGTTVARAVSAALAPIRGTLWVYEGFEESLKKRLINELIKRKVSHKEIIVPDPLVAGPLIESYRFASHTALNDVYIKLLASSMTKELAHTAHPAFVRLLQAMTPDEALLLKYLCLNRQCASILEVHAYHPDDAVGQYLLVRHFSRLGELSGCGYPQLTTSYIDNLVRLGILEILDGTLLEDEYKIEYEKLEKMATFDRFEKDIEDVSYDQIRTSRKALKFTDFGKQFCAACKIDQKLVFITSNHVS